VLKYSVSQAYSASIVWQAKHLLWWTS